MVLLKATARDMSHVVLPDGVKYDVVDGFVNVHESHIAAVKSVGFVDWKPEPVAEVAPAPVAAPKAAEPPKAVSK